jgi:hypothetical protein
MARSRYSRIRSGLIQHYKKIYKAETSRGETKCRETGQDLVDLEQDWVAAESLSRNKLAVFHEGKQVVIITLIVPIQLEKPFLE